MQDIIGEVLRQERAAESALTKAAERLESEVVLERQRIEEEHARKIAEAQAQHARELEQMHRQLDAHCAREEAAHEARIAAYRTLPQSSIDKTATAVLEVLKWPQKPSSE